jgi:hypothetical protein
MSYYYNGKEFFTSIKGSVHDILLWYENPTIVHMTHPHRCYAIFDTSQSFEAWYLNTSPSDRYFDEVILDAPQKMRLDIDTHVRDKITRGRWDEMLHEYQRAMICVFEGAELSPDVLVYESNDEMTGKFSSHMIASDFSFDREVCIGLSAMMYDELDESMRHHMDMGVYKSMQNMRLEGSKKPTTNRYKHLRGHTSISPRLLDGMVSYTSNTKYVQLDVPYDDHMFLGGISDGF